jgi:hypothetical protein
MISGLPTNTVADGAGRHALSTKAEWRAKVIGRYGQYAQMGIIYNWKPSDFKNFMGEPDRTATLGDHAFWYYNCSDGDIVLSMDAMNLNAGVMQGKINDN